MSTDRDVERIVRSWMDEGVTALPDRVLDLVLDQIPATPQRRAGWLARRFPTLSTYARIGLVAAAVIVAVAVGIGLYANSGIGGPPPEASASSAPSVVPSPSSAASTPPPNSIVGTWVAGAATCEQQVATIVAAGFTSEQMAAGGIDPTCANGIVAEGFDYTIGSQVTVTFLSTGSLTEFEDGVIGWNARYTLGEGSTFQATDTDSPAICTTWRYAIDGDQLTLELIDPACAGGVVAPILDQLAQTAIFQTSSFTRR